MVTKAVWRRQLAVGFSRDVGTKTAGGTPALKNLAIAGMNMSPDKQVVSVLGRALECDFRPAVEVVLRPSPAVVKYDNSKSCINEKT